MKKMQQAKCSFCMQERYCVKSPLSEDFICVKCVQDSKEVSGDLEIGAIECPKCKKHDKIVVTMQNGALIEYSSITKDMNGLLCYIPTYFKGESKKVDRRKANCCYCNFEIPLYLLDRSVYIK